MADLIAIVYRDETTAKEAAAEVRVFIEPRGIAVITRDTQGTFRTDASHHPISGRMALDSSWVLLFHDLFGLPVGGITGGAGLFTSGVNTKFKEQVRGMLRPGTSALFLSVDKVTPPRGHTLIGAVKRLSKYGGAVVTTLPVKSEWDSLSAVYGAAPPGPSFTPPPPPKPPKRSGQPDES